MPTGANSLHWFQPICHPPNKKLDTQLLVQKNLQRLRPSWKAGYLYGHLTSGDDLGRLDETFIIHLQDERVENYPSLWYFRALDVLIATYVLRGSGYLVSG